MKEERTWVRLVEQSLKMENLQVSVARELADAMLMRKPFPGDLAITNQGDPSAEIYITHDIDWINPLHPHSILKTCFRGSEWLTFSQLTQPTIFLKNIEQLILFEKEENIRSIYLLGSNRNFHSLGRYNIRYTLQQPLFKQLILLLNSAGIEIGLHSEHGSDLDIQTKGLEVSSGHPIRYHRRHFLKFDPLTLWKGLARNAIGIDFSIADARHPGFKNGIPRHFQTIDFDEQKLLPVTSLPTLLSDNAFFFNEKSEVFRQFRKALTLAGKHKAKVAILLHPENMLIKPALWDYYKEILHICRNESTIISP